MPLSARTGDGVDALSASSRRRLPEGPRYYPEGVTTDQPEMFLAAELLREQLLKMARDELPHAITVIAEEIEPDDDEARTSKADERDEPDEGDGVLRIRARILVERESQKGMVIGRGGAVLKVAGTRRARNWRRCSAPASISRPGWPSSATGSAAPMPSTVSGTSSQANTSC